MSRIIEILEHVVVSGEVAFKGELIECAEGDARALVAYGKAMFHVEPTQPAADEDEKLVNRDASSKVTNRDPK